MASYDIGIWSSILRLTLESKYGKISGGVLGKEDSRHYSGLTGTNEYQDFPKGFMKDSAWTLHWKLKGGGEPKNRWDWISYPVHIGVKLNRKKGKRTKGKMVGKNKELRYYFISCTLKTQADIHWHYTLLYAVHYTVNASAYMHTKSFQSCLILWDPLDYSPPGSSAHGILQARILEQVAMPSSRWSSWPRDQTHVSYVSCVGKGVLYH